MKRVPANRKFIVPGFKFAGISAGIKKSGDRDLALIYSESPAIAAGMFTTNRIKAAPVKLAIENITSQKAQAIIINSGNANACTGKKGIKDAREVNKKTAEELGIPSELVYVSSTGIIGKPLPVEKINNAVPGLVDKLSPSSLRQVASAMMTTDTFAKMSSRKLKIGRKRGTITGIAKGAGMICPNMATMLCFIVTDIAINRQALDSALREAVTSSFNRLIIDNDMSTNDTVMILANGNLQNRPITKRSAEFNIFKNALNEITYDLARMIAEDGEGATKLIEVIVKGALTEADAEKIALAIANSMLVKTAIYGQDPNWGRIVAAIGYSGVEVNENTLDISLNKIKLVRKGLGTNKEKVARKTLSKKNIIITVDLGIGKETAKALTCDLTEGYIKINAHYST
ncbi:MAG: bifunctional glutamate N-acetyltransferase/amino-acid acetyltransferase ArgJ [Nitrospirae bacterium]|nr:bifunctional glutamate N-acetyltransferase/amino-acid acetyltransferase ArgJ [Nitrospirota bacterium]